MYQRVTHALCEEGQTAYRYGGTHEIILPYYDELWYFYLNNLCISYCIDKANFKRALV